MFHMQQCLGNAVKVICEWKDLFAQPPSCGYLMSVFTDSSGYIFLQVFPQTDGSLLNYWFRLLYKGIKSDMVAQRKQQSRLAFCLGWCQMDAARKLYKIWQKLRDDFSNVLPVFSNLHLIILLSQRHQLYI